MPLSDWTTVTGSSDASTIIRNVVASAALPPAPPGQMEAYVYGARAVAPGAFGLYTNQANFAPVDIDKSSQITIALRATGGAQPFAFAGLQGTPEVGHLAYQLGLDAYGYLTLSKGSLIDGAPSTILRHASAPTPPGAWLHVRLDVVVNANGDVVLNAWTSSSGSVVAPAWERTLERYIDDALAVNAGLPLRGGYLGYGARMTAAQQVALFASATSARGA